MSKKGFKSEFSNLLGTSQMPVAEQQLSTAQDNTHAHDNDKTTTRSTDHAEARATFIVQEELLDKIRSIAYWDRLQIKEVVNAALLRYIEQWESQNGVVKPTKK
jgi:hypothetical protein